MTALLYKFYMQSSHRSTPLPNQPPKTQKSKHKTITKPLKSQGELKLDKSTVRSEKRGKYRGSQQWMDEWEVERAFAVHSSNKIDYNQCVLSLRLLGCLEEEQDCAVFKSLWKEKGQEYIDLGALQEYYMKMVKKEKQQSMRELFMMLSGGSMTISEGTLGAMIREVGWKGEAAIILSEIGTADSISLQEFSRALNAHFALG